MEDKEKLYENDDKSINENTSLANVSKNEILTNKVDSLNNNLIEDIVEETNVDKLKDLTHLFNVNMAKKSMIRLLKLNGLMDVVNEEVAKRLQDASDIDDRDLVKYVQVIQNQIDKSTEALNNIDSTPTIQINQQNNNIDINVDKKEQLARESKEKVIDVISKILKVSNEKGSNTSEDNVIEIIEDDENIQNMKEENN